MWAKIKSLINPNAFQSDAFIAMSLLAVFAAIFRFVCEGATIIIGGHTIVSNMHTDGASYSLFLAPVLAAHTYLEGKSNDTKN